jgi:two-component sensor histidine kinase/DNA-binding response OmpR family regulator
MSTKERVNILLVDDQKGKLLSYEAILAELDENLLKASSAREAFQFLLKNDIAVVLVDVCMPELDGFELAAMIRDHPRFQRTAIIFISAILLAETDHLRGYEMGAVDYVPVPVVPEVLRAKVRVFADLYRKTRELEKFNSELEQRVKDRTAALEAVNAQLIESESRRSLALAAGQMGAWDWEIETGRCSWDAGQYRIFGRDPGTFEPTFATIKPLIHPEDLQRITEAFAGPATKKSFQTEARIIQPSGEVRWCICAAAATIDEYSHVTRVSGVTIDITDRKEAEERQLLLAREVDHRARNALAVVQAIVRLTRADSMQDYLALVEGRIGSLAQAHTLLSNSRWQGADVARLLSEELAPYRTSAGRVELEGASILVAPDRAQVVALAVHELATNSAKYGALSSEAGRLSVAWKIEEGILVIDWREFGGPPVKPPISQGFGTKIFEGAIKRQIGGNVALDWRSTGLNCRLSIPYGVADGASPTTHDEHPEGPPPGTRKRVLLAEDEVLVGMMMRDLLSELGFFVAGPFCSLEEACAALDQQEFDCAILDINLAGRPVYPLAELLGARSTPFFFVSGYGVESVDPRFANIPVLQKPIVRDLLAELIRQKLDLGPNPAAQELDRQPSEYARAVP